MARPLVTLAVSTYNRADGYLREALACAVAQTYAPLEIVVVDNASTDRTGEVVASMADDRVRYIRNETNVGANGNFNACLSHARGTYFLLLHDDDHVDADFVERCMAAVEHRGPEEPLPGLVRTGHRVMDAAGTTLSSQPNRARNGSVADLVRDWFERRTGMYFCNTMFHTEALREAGGFHSKRELFIDVAAVVRIAARWPVLNVPDVLASFRRHGGNNGTAQSIEAWCDDSKYLLDLMGDVAPEHAAELRERGLTYFISNNYTRATRLKDPIQRARAFWTVYKFFGFRHSPLRFVVYRRLQHLRQTVGGSSV